jgi:hypothetical protein
MAVHIPIDLTNMRMVDYIKNSVKMGIQVTMAHANELAGYAKEAIGIFTPHDSGFMKRNIKSWNIKSTGFSATMEVGWRSRDFGKLGFYPVHVLRGTGLYGPWREPIVAQNKWGVFVFDSHGERIVAKVIRGQEPHPIFESAMPLIQDKMLAIINRSMIQGFQVNSYAGRGTGQTYYKHRGM